VGEQGTPHLQGYFEVSNPMLISQLQRWPCFAGQGLAIFVARGTAVQNTRYCTKDDEFYEKFGEFSVSREGQGRRTDWHTLPDAVKEGMATRELAELAPNLVMAHINKVGAWRQALGPLRQRTELTRFKIFWGPSGSGKTTETARVAEQLAVENNWRIYYKSDGDKWWPGYDGQEIIVVEEMSGTRFPFRTLLQLLDKPPLSIQFKGGDCQFLGRIVLFNCNDHPCN